MRSHHQISQFIASLLLPPIQKFLPGSADLPNARYDSSARLPDLTFRPDSKYLSRFGDRPRFSFITPDSMKLPIARFNFSSRFEADSSSAHKNIQNIRRLCFGDAATSQKQMPDSPVHEFLPIRGFSKYSAGVNSAPDCLKFPIGSGSRLLQTPRYTDSTELPDYPIRRFPIRPDSYQEVSYIFNSQYTTLAAGY